ncbi:MAG: family transposase [Edaphobacter sp.]|nr:family transposase [Edaphobacter sp.]
MADLSDVQWDYVRLFVEWQQKSRMDGREGRWSDARQVLNGVLWILRTGAPRKDLPARTRLVIGASSNDGSGQEFWKAFCGRSVKTCWLVGRSI